MKYLVGRNNLSCTIFVPFDCKNNCPFCTSKSMYKDIVPDTDQIIHDIHNLNDNKDIKSYVLTGGEPFANLEITKKLIHNMEKICYVNTTLPLSDDIDDIISYINSENKIKGINISRHIGFKFNNVADLDIIDQIIKSVRINTVVNNEFSINEFKQFVEYWGSDSRSINLRADYTKINTDTLRSRDDIETQLATEYVHNGSGGCLVCNTTEFEAPRCRVTYHRGLMYSSVKFNDKLYINDIIIKPDGSIYNDWNFKMDPEFNDWIIPRKDINIVITIVDLETNSMYFYSGRNLNTLLISSSYEDSEYIHSQRELNQVTDCLNDMFKGMKYEIKTNYV